jgi:Concanavalin A-like lectin/glucanases superfamily
MRGQRGIAAFLGVAAAVTSLATCETRTLQTIGPPPPPPPLQQGLVAHWNCDESGGDVLHDTSGNNYHGQITGGTFTAGRFGNALSLQRGQYVTVPNFPNATTSWSVSAWTKIPSSDPGDVCLISTELAGGGGWAMRVNNLAQTCTFRFRVGSDNGVDTYASHEGLGVSATDRFVHLVAVVDGQAMTLTLYVDGAVRDSPTPIPQTISRGLSDLLIGRSGLAGEDYAGLIDDIAIYSRALTLAEVTRLRSEAAPNITSPAVSLDAGNGSPDAAEIRD